ncbi:hypothetical protein K435DRAFT_598785, partial [Dendrothele bispora CBS 962.96]
KIPKPDGEVGRPGRGGYNLKDALGLGDKQYRAVYKYITQLCQENLDLNVAYTLQDIDDLDLVRYEAQLEYPFLSNYSEEWATNDFIRRILKYRKSALK